MNGLGIRSVAPPAAPKATVTPPRVNAKPIERRVNTLAEYYRWTGFLRLWHRVR